MDIDLSKLRIKILGQEISLGGTEQLSELRQKLKEAGAPELLSDAEWRGQQSGIGRRRTLSDTGGVIPRSAGFARSARPAVRRPVRAVKRQPAEPSAKLTVEEDTLIDREFQKIPELTEVFIDCLADFPELVEKSIECRATHSNELSAAKGTLKGNPVVILFVPDQAWGQWLALKPLIYHELAHYISLTDPDRVFEERADEKSKELWRKLREMGQAQCSEDRDR